MPKEEPICTEGVVLESLPNGMFRVSLTKFNDKVILCHPSGKIRINNIHIQPNDKVDIEMSPYDLTKGRITFRHK